MDVTKKTFNVLTLGPLILAPLLAVEFPRVLAYIPILSGLLGALALWFGWRQWPKFSKPLVIFFAGILVLAGISLTWSVFPDTSVERAAKLLCLLPFYALFFAVLRAGARYFWGDAHKYILVSCALGAIFTSIDILLDGAFYRMVRQIPEQALDTSAVFNRGAVTVLLMGMTAFLLLDKKITVLGGFGFLSIVFMLFFIQSQSAQLAFVFILFFFFLFPFRQKMAWQILFACFAFAMIAKPFIVPWLYDQFPESLNEIYLIEQAYVSNRLEIWDYVSRHIADNPVIGCGLEFTRDYTGFISDHRFMSSNIILHPHSYILQIWVELGVIGILGAIAGVGFLMRTLWQLENQTLKRAGLTILVSTLLVGSFSYGLWQSWWLGLMCLIAAIPVIQMESQKTA